MPINRIAIIEPWLRNYSGHYYNFTSELVHGLESIFKTTSIHVIVGKYCNVKEDNFIYLFTEDYNSFYFQKRRLHKLTKLYKDGRKLSKIIEDLLKKYDVLFFPEGHSLSVLVAVMLFTQVKKPIFLYVHTFDALKGNQGLLIRFLLAFSTNLSNVYFLTYNDFEEYDKKTKKFLNHLERKVGGIVFGAPYCVPKTTVLNVHEETVSNCNHFTVSYLGEARPTKNFPKVVELVSYSTRKKIDLYFQICAFTPPYKHSFDLLFYNKIRELKELKTEKLRVFEEPMTKEEYLEALAKSSVVLLLYDKITYRTSFSGILLEAWAYGKPVITTSGTWLARQVEKYGGGVIVQSTEPEEVLKAIEEIRKNYEKYQNEALEAGKQLVQKHNGVELARLIKQILESRA